MPTYVPIIAKNPIRSPDGSKARAAALISFSKRVPSSIVNPIM